jgi:predicted SAM-dependent methyltransferase
MKLNLGAGEDRREGYLSVDLRADVADVAADVGALPFRAGSVDRLLALDILEHVPATRTASLLAEWRRVLRPRGHLTVRVPNLYQLARGIVGFTDAQRWNRVHQYVTNVYGGHRWGPDGALDAHHWGFVPETLYRTLADAGFEVESDDLALNNTVEAVRA